MVARNGGGNNAYSSLTKEGTPFILVDQSVLASPLSVQEFTMDHELAHIQKGHATPEMHTLMHNSKDPNQFHRIIEAEADKTAVCLAPNPEVSARGGEDYFKARIDEIELKYSRDPAAKQKEYERNSVGHPDPRLRKHDIPHYVQECSEVTPPLATPAQRWGDAEPSRNSKAK